ncbi:hypothetical protein [Gracilimonas mengyeensis]|uniref:Uncharacterized protein n=1 Tax=Gracilimonas mengyeensis TaxID=1302730 RepID=A0A521B129_9BACT|nr:hypothetical protein [Gracilimonas mengyeensis]SMO40802.1 hypothetical protein SAMN06265219_101496 [Gracilimonas mengyeensis]
MYKTILTILGIALFLIYVAGVVYWFEAEKEVRILCSMFNEGQSVEAVRHTLDTGNLLHYKESDDVIIVNSSYTMSTTECTVSLSDTATVVASTYQQSLRLERTAGIFAAFLTFLLAVFQMLLVLGVQWGEWAWGGFHKKLPLSLRLGSFISFLILIFAGFSVLAATGFSSIIPEAISRITVFILTGIFLLSIIGNFNSKSAKERKVMIPLSILLSSCYLIVTVFLLG